MVDESFNKDKRLFRDSVKRAKEYGAIPEDGGLTFEVWEYIKELFGHRCAYCKKKHDNLGIDHVVPFSRGGLHIWQNVVPACRSCNVRKGGSERKISRGRCSIRMLRKIRMPKDWFEKLSKKQVA